MTLLFSWLATKCFSKASVKPQVMPFNVGVYLPFIQLIDPICLNQFLAVVKIVNSLPVIQKEKLSVCHNCGACCAFFVVAFPSAEIDSEIGGIVPAAMTLPFDNHRSYMKGTNSKGHRCEALQGVVGHHVSCTIYENRPSSCRNFYVSWELDKGNELCDKARQAYGLHSFSKY